MIAAQGRKLSPSLRLRESKGANGQNSPAICIFRFGGDAGIEGVMEPNRVRIFLMLVGVPGHV